MYFYTSAFFFFKIIYISHIIYNIKIDLNAPEYNIE